MSLSLVLGGRRMRGVLVSSRVRRGQLFWGFLFLFFLNNNIRVCYVRDRG